MFGGKYHLTPCKPPSAAKGFEMNAVCSAIYYPTTILAASETTLGGGGGGGDMLAPSASVEPDWQKPLSLNPLFFPPSLFRLF